MPDIKPKGFAVLSVLVVVLAAMLASIAGIFIMTKHQIEITSATLDSYQSYYTAEAGLEDALLRIVSGMNMPGTTTLEIGDSSTTIIVLDRGDGSMVLDSTGVLSNRFRKVGLTLTASSTGADLELELGAASGLGGILMENSCSVTGNVMANNDITMENTAVITGNVTIALDTSNITGGTVTGDVSVYRCENTEISGVLTSVEQSGCTSTDSVSLSEEIPLFDDFITDEEIDEWKAEAEAGGTLSGPYEQDDDTHYLGPAKIDGDMNLSNKAIVYLTGPVWVTGNISLLNQAQLRIDSGYGDESEVVISDGVIEAGNTASAHGSGSSKSFLVLLSTYADDTAIDIDNSFSADILYAKNEWIRITNATDLKHVTGYGIHLRNGASLTYDPEMAAIDLGNGGGGDGTSTTFWIVGDWNETE